MMNECKWVKDSSRKCSNILTIKSGRITITITNTHVDHKPEWVYHCYELGMKAIELPKGIDEDEAKCTAIEWVAYAISLLVLDIKAIEQSEVGAYWND